MRLLDRRRGMGGKAQEVDPYEGCIVLEFTETIENTPRQLTYNNNNVISYLEKLIVDGVEQPIQKNYQYTFGLGSHKIGWKFNSSIIYANVMASVSNSPQLASVDNALVIIPENITEIKSMAMRSIPAYSPYRGVICHAIIPPTAVSSSIGLWYLNGIGERSLRVPAESVEDYKVADGWSTYAGYIIAK